MKRKTLIAIDIILAIMLLICLAWAVQLTIADEAKKEIYTTPDAENPLTTQGEEINPNHNNDLEDSGNYTEDSLSTESNTIETFENIATENEDTVPAASDPEITTQPMVNIEPQESTETESTASEPDYTDSGDTEPVIPTDTEPAASEATEGMAPPLGENQTPWA